MARRRMLGWVIAAVVILAMGVGSALAADKAPRVTKEKLKEMMGKGEVVVLDVRSGSDWEKAQSKIQGAVREDPDKPTQSWAGKYAKDKTLVLYCA